jgi:hypothetical protein
MGAGRGARDGRFTRPAQVIAKEGRIGRTLESAGFVENLSRRSPFSSNRWTMRSVVTAASRMLLGAQHSAVTRCMTPAASGGGVMSAAAGGGRYIAAGERQTYLRPQPRAARSSCGAAASRAATFACVVLCRRTSGRGGGFLLPLPGGRLFLPATQRWL